jgi:hypothetical protein
MLLPGQVQQGDPEASPASLRSRWSQRPRRMPTVLAPALPALCLLAFVTAGMIDPPQSGLTSQLHITKLATTQPADQSTWSVTPR